MTAVISSIVRSPKNAARTRWILKLSPCLVFAIETVSELFKLSYFNLLKNILAYLNALILFSILLYRQTDFFCYFRITFFFRIVEEEKI